MFRTPVVVLAALLTACALKPPLVVQATGKGENCAVRVNGTVFSNGEFQQTRLKRLAKEHGRRVIVDSDSQTPYRCIGGTIYNLQRAGMRVVSVRVDGAELPSH